MLGLWWAMGMERGLTALTAIRRELALDYEPGMQWALCLFKVSGGKGRDV